MRMFKGRKAVTRKEDLELMTDEKQDQEKGMEEVQKGKASTHKNVGGTMS